MAKIEIEVFGGLKQFFPKQFNIEKQPRATFGDVISYLTDKNPEAEALLDQCIVAAGSEIYSKNTAIDNFSSIVIMPPYSGG